MVKLHLKQGDESLFLYETTCQAELSELIPQLVRIQNGRLKIERLFYGEYKCMYSKLTNVRRPLMCVLNLKTLSILFTPLLIVFSVTNVC